MCVDFVSTWLANIYCWNDIKSEKERACIFCNPGLLIIKNISTESQWWFLPAKIREVLHGRLERSNLIMSNWPCRLQWSPAAGMLQPEQPEQQWQPSRRGRLSRCPGAACDQLVHLLRAAPPGSCGRALLHGRKSLSKWQNFQKRTSITCQNALWESSQLSLRSCICFINYNLYLVSFTRLLAIPYSRYGQVQDVLFVSSSILFLLPWLPHERRVFESSPRHLLKSQTISSGMAEPPRSSPPSNSNQSSARPLCPAPTPTQAFSQGYTL